MKFLVVLFLVGFASASLRDVLDDAADEVLRDYVNAMELNPSLKNYLALAEGDDETEDEIKTELGKKLREHLDLVLEQIKDAIDHGKVVKESLKEKVKEIREQLKKIKVDIGERAKQLLEKIKEKAKDYLRKLLEKLGLKDKEEVEVRSFGTFREKLRNMKEWMMEKFDPEAFKGKVEEIFGKGSEIARQLVDKLKEGGEKAKQNILNFIRRLLGEEEEVEEKRSLSEYWEKVKNYFKDLHMELKEKFLKFGEWVKDIANKGLDKAKTKVQNLKQIAREMIDHAKDLSKEVAVEGLEFLRPYKEDLGSLWDQVKETVKDVMNRKD